MGCPYIPRCSKPPTGAYISGGDYDLGSLRMPLSSSSTDIINSGCGALPTTQEISGECMGVDIDSCDGGARIATQTQSQNQDNNNCSGDAMHLLGTNCEDEMYVDGAMAPALKAPRAP